MRFSLWQTRFTAQGNRSKRRVPISGTLDLYGENSGVRLYYAEYKTEQENGVFSAENFDIGSSKKR